MTNCCCCRCRASGLPHCGDCDRGASRRGLIACLIAFPLLPIAGYAGMGGLILWAAMVCVGAGWLMSKS